MSLYPFAVLDLPHDATDEEVAARYRELVHAFPPEQAPAEFQAIRAAYEALKDRRVRLRTRLTWFDRTGRALATHPRLDRAPRPRLALDELRRLLGGT